MQRVRGELRRVAPLGGEPAERIRDGRRRDRRDGEKRLAAHKLHGGARRGTCSGAAARVEAGVGDGLPLHGHGDPDRIAARRAARRPEMRSVGEPSAPARSREVVLQGRERQSDLRFLHKGQPGALRGTPG